MTPCPASIQTYGIEEQVNPLAKVSRFRQVVSDEAIRTKP